MPTLKKTVLEQLYTSKELLKGAKEVTYVSADFILPECSCCWHSHPHTWGMAAEHTQVQVHLPSPQLDRGLWMATNWPNLSLSSKSASNLCIPCGHWLAWVVLSHSLCPDLYRHSKAPQCSTLKEHPLHRPLLESAAVHSKGQQILSAHMKLCPGTASPSQNWARRNQGGTPSTGSDLKMER